MRILEADPTVRRFGGQPAQLRFFFERQHRLHVPDLLVEWNEGVPTILDVKPAHLIYRCEPALRHATRAYFEKVASCVQKSGFRYGLVTERSIRAEPRLSNAKLVLRGSYPQFDRAKFFMVQMAVAEMDADFTADAIRSLVPSDCDVVGSLMRMIFLGEVTFDPTRPIGPTTTFSRR